MKTQTPFWRIFLATLAFWGMYLLGGSLVMIVNWLYSLSSYVESSIFDPNSSMNFLLQVFSNAIGCSFGIYFYIQITEESAYASLLVNCVLGFALSVLLAWHSFFISNDSTAHSIGIALSVIPMIYGIYISVKNIKEGY